MNLNRRSFLSALSAVPIIGALVPKAAAEPNVDRQSHPWTFLRKRRPYRYVPQPQAEAFHNGPVYYGLGIITGDRSSGKTWAAAGKIARLASTSDRRFAVVSPKEANAMQLQPILEMFLGQSVSKSARGKLQLHSGSQIEFMSVGFNGCASRYSLMWFDECELDNSLLDSVRSCCNCFIATNYDVPSFSFEHFNRDSLRKWLRTQPMPTCAECSHWHERLVSDEVFYNTAEELFAARKAHS